MMRLCCVIYIYSAEGGGSLERIRIDKIGRGDSPRDESKDHRIFQSSPLKDP